MGLLWTHNRWGKTPDPLFFSLSILCASVSLWFSWPNLQVAGPACRCYHYKVEVSGLFLNWRPTMRKPRVAHFLLALVLLAQADDAWLGLPTPCAAGDDDEYIPAKRIEAPTEFASHQTPAPVDLIAPSTTSFADQRSSPSELVLARSFTPPPLHVFMSMQC